MVNQTEKQIIWNIECCSAPKAIRYCKKCGKTVEFISSGQFRINSQRRSLDVWLIYKCTHCNTTWNNTIYSRISPRHISTSLLERFHANDEALAMQCSMNIQLLKQNGAEVEMPDYQIIGDANILQEQVSLRIDSQYPLPLKLTSVLRKKLKLSRRELANLFADKCICSQSARDLQRCKLDQTITIAISFRYKKQTVS